MKPLQLLTIKRQCRWASTCLTGMLISTLKDWEWKCVCVCVCAWALQNVVRSYNYQNCHLQQICHVMFRTTIGAPHSFLWWKYSCSLRSTYQLCYHCLGWAAHNQPIQFCLIKKFQQEQQQQQKTVKGTGELSFNQESASVPIILVWIADSFIPSHCESLLTVWIWLGIGY